MNSQQAFGKKRTSQPFLTGSTISSLCMHAISLTGKEIRMEIHRKVYRILHRWKSVLVLYQLFKGQAFSPPPECKRQGGMRISMEAKQEWR